MKPTLRPYRVVRAELRQEDYTMLDKYCECGMADQDAQPHFHAATCPVGIHARRLINLRIECHQAYLVSPQYKAKKALDWLAARHYSHLDMFIIMCGTLEVAWREWWWAGAIFGFHLVVLLAIRAAKGKVSE